MMIQQKQTKETKTEKNRISSFSSLPSVQSPNLFEWAACAERLEEARQRRKHRCSTCGCLMEPGHGCARVRWNKAKGQFDHE
jgi:formylmethanofuran dehydrogenase subunit E